MIEAGKLNYTDHHRLFSVEHDTLLLLIRLVVHHCPVSAHPFSLLAWLVAA